MGICKKCKKKTDLYCFKHKVPICAACLTNADNEHCMCHVGSYNDFLNSTTEVLDDLIKAPCPTCNEAFTDSHDVLRLPCLRLFFSISHHSQSRFVFVFVFVFFTFFFFFCCCCLMFVYSNRFGSSEVFRECCNCTSC